jgi:hypothetical protein
MELNRAFRSLLRLSVYGQPAGLSTFVGYARRANGAIQPIVRSHRAGPKILRFRSGDADWLDSEVCVNDM